jgi:hypothetical protein
LNIVLLILVFIIGFCSGAIYATNQLYPPAYPGTGDWNGDGAINWLDLLTALQELFFGPVYPEIVYN